ncbi:tRNA 2'-phosphotransferase 1 [Actinomortierella ambigua]|nr:tRNA 2'-phosphotransferase 1 [Actinomortierella ambigua]
MSATPSPHPPATDSAAPAQLGQSAENSHSTPTSSNSKKKQGQQSPRQADPSQGPSDQGQSGTAPPTKRGGRRGGGGGRGDSPQVRLSKALSWLLRHNAVAQGVAIGADGFCRLDEVLAHSRFKGFSVDDVHVVVRDSDKKRFEIVERDGITFIRAVQGHSIQEVKDEGHEIITDATQLPIAVHGTTMAAWEIIATEGLSRMNRNHIHMATGLPGENGVISGMRAKSTVHIYIDTAKAIKDGIKFQRSTNNVILSDGKNGDGVIAPEYFSVVKSSSGKILFPLPQ